MYFCLLFLLDFFEQQRSGPQHLDDDLPWATSPPLSPSASAAAAARLRSPPSVESSVAAAAWHRDVAAVVG